MIKELDPTTAPQLLKIGTKVQIFLQRPAAWVSHTIVGYYTVAYSQSHTPVIFVRAVDGAGFLTAREFDQIRVVD